MDACPSAFLSCDVENGAGDSYPAAQIGDAGGWAVELIPMDFYLGR